MSKVAFYTLGCKVNQAETGLLKSQFLANGYEVVEPVVKTDLLVINTCAVTHVAERKSRNMIRRSLKLNPATKVIVCGCYVNLEEKELKRQIPKIFKLIAQKNKTDISRWGIPLAINKTHKPVIKFSRYREFLKIQDGCDQFCSYCVVPYARPELSSLDPKQVIAQAETLVANGVTEVILTGINLGKYRYQNLDLSGLLPMLENIKGLQRIRLSSIEPNFITLALIQAIKASKLTARHLHIPLQSGSDTILQKMRRRYTVAEYIKLIEYIRYYLGEIGLTTDIILGFPGETEQTFQETCQTIRQIGFADLHIFKYSPRAQTAAGSLSSGLTMEQLKRMSGKMAELAAQLKKDFLQKFIGRNIEVLIEQSHGNYAEGLTSEYLRTYIYKKNLPDGHLVQVTPQKLREDILIIV